MLSFGSWVTFNTQLDTDLALECMQAAHDAGCNFFDNAEAYAGGKSEEIMGKALAQLGWPRWSYMVTTKFFWGIHARPGQHDATRSTASTCRRRSTARSSGSGSTSSTSRTAIAPTRTPRSRRRCGR